jgi:hypothetical protein
MRAIKEELRLTTSQLVNELNAYERKFHARSYHAKDADGKPALLPMNRVLMSSYLQGWVMQDSYMAAVCQRLERLSVYKKETSKGHATGHDIRKIMDEWFKTLNIDPKSSAVSPFRQLGRNIAPFYKRPVLASVEGVFRLGLTKGPVRAYTITDTQDVAHEFWLNKAEPVLVKNGQSVKVGDVIQYSVLMKTETKDGQVVVTNEPSINHTTFFRWYTDNKMPRSIKTIELVQAAVDETRKSLK